MNQPVLQLEDFGITDLEVHWHAPEVEGQEHASNLRLGYKIARRKDQPERYRIALEINDEKKNPEGRVLLALRVNAIGFFIFPTSTPPDQRARLIRTVALPILYSTTRGALQTVSGVLPPGSRYTLPTVSIFDVIREVEGPKEPKRKEKPRAASIVGTSGRSIHRKAANS